MVVEMQYLVLEEIPEGVVVLVEPTMVCQSSLTQRSRTRTREYDVTTCGYWLVLVCVGVWACERVFGVV